MRAKVHKNRSIANAYYEREEQTFAESRIKSSRRFYVHRGSIYQVRKKYGADQSREGLGADHAGFSGELSEDCHTSEQENSERLSKAGGHDDAVCGPLVKP